MKDPCKTCNNNIKPHIWCDKKREYVKYLEDNTDDVPYLDKLKSINVSPKATPTRKGVSK